MNHFSSLLRPRRNSKSYREKFVSIKKNIHDTAVVMLCHRGSGYVGVQSHNSQTLLEGRGHSAMIALRDVGRIKLI